MCKICHSCEDILKYLRGSSLRSCQLLISLKHRPIYAPKYSLTCVHKAPYLNLTGPVKCGPRADILSIWKFSSHPYLDLLRNGSTNNKEILLHIILFWRFSSPLLYHIWTSNAKPYWFGIGIKEKKKILCFFFFKLTVGSESFTSCGSHEKNDLLLVGSSITVSFTNNVQCRYESLSASENWIFYNPGLG